MQLTYDGWEHLLLSRGGMEPFRYPPGLLTVVTLNHSNPCSIQLSISSDNISVESEGYTNCGQFKTHTHIQFTKVVVVLTLRTRSGKRNIISRWDMLRYQLVQKHVHVCAKKKKWEWPTHVGLPDIVPEFTFIGLLYDMRSYLCSVWIH